MTADEIRSSGTGSPHYQDMRGLEWALIEIAAQLAELNSNINGIGMALNFIAKK